MGFDLQNNNSARASRFFVHVHFLPSLNDYDVKVPNFTVYGGCKQANTKLYSFSRCTVVYYAYHWKYIINSYLCVRFVRFDV